MPGVAQRVPGSLGSYISWNSAREGGEFSLTHGPPLPPGIFLVLIFTGNWVDSRAVVQSEGDTSLKNPLTLPRIDPETVWLVAQRLNHYAIPGQVCCVQKLIKFWPKQQLIKLPSGRSSERGWVVFTFVHQSLSSEICFSFSVNPFLIGYFSRGLRWLPLYCI